MPPAPAHFLQNGIGNKNNVVRKNDTTVKKIKSTKFNSPRKVSPKISPKASSKPGPKTSPKKTTRSLPKKTRTVAIDLTGKSVLELNLKKHWFDLMRVGIKTEEYREAGEWLYSRIYKRDKEGNIIDKKKYDFIKFNNGMKERTPYFIAEYKGFTRYSGKPYIKEFKCPFSKKTYEVAVHNDTFALGLGKVVEEGYVFEKIRFPEKLRV